jgi:pyruvate ferredoxin oxidoreductase alpha subunit
VLDPRDPVSIGAMVGPEAFTEVRYLAFERMGQALDVIPAVAADFRKSFGRDCGGLVRPYRAGDAELVVVALGSVLGTLKDAVDELRDDGMLVGALGVTTFRPFPVQAVRDALGFDDRLRRLVVIERALAPGAGGIVTADLRTALAAADGRPPREQDTIISTVIAGLGGRAITRRSLRDMIASAARGALPALSFLDLDTGLVERELARMRTTRRSGPIAENMLRDLGATPVR